MSALFSWFAIKFFFVKLLYMTRFRSTVAGNFCRPMTAGLVGGIAAVGRRVAAADPIQFPLLALTLSQNISVIKTKEKWNNTFWKRSNKTTFFSNKYLSTSIQVRNSTYAIIFLVYVDYNYVVQSRWLVWNDAILGSRHFDITYYKLFFFQCT